MKKFKKKLLAKIAPFFIYICVWFIYLTCKNKFFISENAKKSNFIAAFWHGNFLMMPFLYKKIRSKPNMSLITSSHNDGAILESFFLFFGLRSIRGSSNKGGIQALKTSLSRLKKGEDIAITPDGPLGPLHSIADGVIAMSIKSDVAICACKVISSKKWILKTWDKFEIPKPFSTIEYHLLEPLILKENDISIDKEQAKQLLKQRLS